jgi:hypothetical protein
VTDEALLQDGCPRLWIAQLTATVTGGTAESVLATWTMDGKPQRAPLTAGPAGSWSTKVTLLPDRDIPWTAVATLTGGGQVASVTRTLRHDCVG